MLAYHHALVQLLAQLAFGFHNEVETLILAVTVTVTLRLTLRLTTPRSALAANPQPQHTATRARDSLRVLTTYYLRLAY